MATAKGKARPAKPRRKSTAAKPRKKSFIKKALGSKAASTKKRRWLWRITKGTAKGTAKLAWKGGSAVTKVAGAKIQTARSNRKFPDGYVPEPGEIPKGKFSRTATTVGDRRFETPEAAMAYSEKMAAAEPPVARAPRPTGTLEWGKAGKVRVRPPTTRKPPAGRHRKAPHKTKAEALIAAHREKLTKIGSKAVAENDIARMIKKAFQGLMDNKPRKLSDMEELALGMEQANARAAEAIESYRLYLIQKGFDPAMLMPLMNIQESYERAALEWTKHIVVIKTEMAPEIAAARRRMEGTAPDDAMLAG